MSNKVRSYRGKMVDMQELSRQHEETRALGNMGVNARGDEIDEEGKIVRPRDKVVREKNAGTVKTSTNASIISSFEDDDDEIVEIKDDPRVVGDKKKTTPQKTTTKSKQDSGSKEPSSTDLDDDQ